MQTNSELIKPKNTDLEQAIDSLGGQSSVARQLKITPQAVQYWARQGEVSPKFIKRMERLTGLDRAALNPRLYSP